MTWVPEPGDIERYRNDPLFHAFVGLVERILIDERVDDLSSHKRARTEDIALRICVALYPMEEFVRRDTDLRAEIERLSRAEWRRPARS